MTIKSWWRCVAGSIFSPLVVSTMVISTQAISAPINSYPGGIVEFKIPKESNQTPSVRYGLSEPVIFKRQDYWQILIGIDLNTLPGEYIVYIKPAEKDAHAYSQKFSVSAALPGEIKLAPSQAILITHNTFSELDFSNSQEPSLPLKYPAQGQWSNNFGTTYQLDDSTISQPQNYTSLTTSTQLLVSAPQRAIISKIEMNENGTARLFLDHGRGLYSIISGLTDLTVDPGNGIPQGAFIGKLQAGDNNLLIWQCVLNGAYIDPEILIGLNL